MRGRERHVARRGPDHSSARRRPIQRARPPPPRQPHLPVRRPSPPRRLHRPCAGQADAHGRAHRAAVSQSQRHQLEAAFPRRLYPRTDAAPDAPDPVRRRVAGPVDRVRERRQPTARARRGPVPRGRHPQRHRRGLEAPRRPVPRGKRRPGGGRRLGGTRSRIRRHEGAGPLRPRRSLAPGRASASTPASWPSRRCSACSSPSSSGVGPALQAARRSPAGVLNATARGASGGVARQPPPQPAGGLRNVAGPGPARRRRTPDPQLSAPPAGRPRFPDRQPRDPAALSAVLPLSRRRPDRRRLRPHRRVHPAHSRRGLRRPGRGRCRSVAEASTSAASSSARASPSRLPHPTPKPFGTPSSPAFSKRWASASSPAGPSTSVTPRPRLRSRSSARAWRGRCSPIRIPLGRRVRSWRDENKYREIVGVAADAYYDVLTRERGNLVYVPYAQSAWGMLMICARTAGDPAAVISSIRSAIWSMDNKLSISNVRTMDEIVDASLAGARFSMFLLRDLRRHCPGAGRHRRSTAWSPTASRSATGRSASASPSGPPAPTSCAWSRRGALRLAAAGVVCGVAGGHGPHPPHVYPALRRQPDRPPHLRGRGRPADRS